MTIGVLLGAFGFLFFIDLVASPTARHFLFFFAESNRKVNWLVRSQSDFFRPDSKCKIFLFSWLSEKLLDAGAKPAARKKNFQC